MRNGLRACVGCILWSAAAMGLGMSAPRAGIAQSEHASPLGRSSEVAEEAAPFAKTEIAKLDDAAYWQRAEQLGIADQVKQSGLPERQRRRLAVAIVREAEAAGMDPLLVVAVIRAESSFNSYSVSAVGARGLMQVMPATGRHLMNQRGEQLGRDANLFDAELNVELGTRYLSGLISQFGSIEEALVAYNAGPAAAKRILQHKERRAQFVAGYPTRVVREWRRLQAAYAPARTSG